MINIHFFGCSYTAGDELVDDMFFPWKQNCKNQDEYFSKKSAIFNSDNSMFSAYDKLNKNLAYPNKIKIKEIETHNHAICGSSLEEQVLNAVEVVNKNKDKLVVYFQLPPGPRKLKLTKTGDNFSFQLNDRFKINDYLLRNYIKASLNFIDIDQFSIEDILNLLFLKNYLFNKSIPCYFIELKDEYKVRRDDVLKNDRYKFLITELENNSELISLENYLSPHRLLGGHYNQTGHKIIADNITNHIIKNLESWNT